MPVNSPAPPELPPARHPSGPYKVCMVCLGNICRSPMAEAVLRDELTRAGLADAVSVDSAGTGDWHIGERMHAPARAELARRGYDGSGHRSLRLIFHDAENGAELKLRPTQAAYKQGTHYTDGNVAHQDLLGKW